MSNKHAGPVGQAVRVCVRLGLHIYSLAKELIYVVVRKRVS